MKPYTLAILLLCPVSLWGQTHSDKIIRDRCVEKARSLSVPDVSEDFEKRTEWIKKQDLWAMTAVRGCLETLKAPQSKEEQDAYVQLQDFVFRAWNATRTAALVLDETLANVRQGSIEKKLESTIEFGSVTLSLGMPQASALAKLTADYTTRDKGEGKWEVSSSKDRSTVGEVDFTNGKLTGAERYWPIQPVTASGLAESLYGAMSSFVEEGRTECTIDTWNQHKPDSEAKSASIRCGHKTIGVMIIDAGKDHILAVTEHLK